MCTDEKAAEVYERAKAVCVTNQIPEACAAFRPRQKEKLREQQFELSDAEQLNTNLFLLRLNRMVAELDQRFSSVNIQVLRGVQACNPDSGSVLYEADLRDLKPEEVLVPKIYLTC